MPHISIDVGKDAMPTPRGLRASVEIVRLLTRKATYPSTDQNLTAMLTIAVETRMLEQDLVASLVSKVSRHHQRILG